MIKASKPSRGNIPLLELTQKGLKDLFQDYEEARKTGTYGFTAPQSLGLEKTGTAEETIGPGLVPKESEEA
jgi:hypothetical protein